jgi:hypothetical protein
MILSLVFLRPKGCPRCSRWAKALSYERIKFSEVNISEGITPEYIGVLGKKCPMLMHNGMGGRREEEGGGEEGGNINNNL